VALVVVVVVPSPQAHLYWVIESPGKGVLLAEALNAWEAPATSVPGFWIEAVGDSGSKAAVPFGAPTPETPS
jgi:hypothetical protein